MAETAHDPPVPPERLAVLHGPDHVKYPLMKARLGREPIELIQEMKHGHYRFKSKRGQPGVLVYDRDGSPVGERMPFRQIAPVLASLSGVSVTYETVRRWYEAVFPGEVDEPEESDEAPAAVPVPAPELEPTALPATPAATTRRGKARKADPVADAGDAGDAGPGDEAAGRIRKAMRRAAVPPAAFLPPAQ